MSSDLSYIDRLTQRYERSGTSLFIRTYLKDTMELVDEFEFTGVVPGAPIPIEVQAVARNILSDIARLGPAVSPVGSSIDASGAPVLMRADGRPAFAVAKAFVGTGGDFEGIGTSIPTSVAGPGDYTTKLQFMGNVRDELGLVDMVNHRIYLPDGYKECRVIYNLAWGAHATGWRGCRTKNGSGGNYGNTRTNSVGAAATTNNNNVTPWIPIVTANAYAPDTVLAGDYFEFWPAQNSGGYLVCGADLASSFVQLEVR